MKDLIFGFFKMIFVAMIEAVKEALKKVDYKMIAYKAYESYRPKLEEKVKATEDKKWDDALLKAVDMVMEKLVKPEEKSE